MNPTAILLPLFWLGGWIAASIWFRRANGKPIMPQKPTDAAFCEDWCSGRSLRNGLTRVGGHAQYLGGSRQRDENVPYQPCLLLRSCHRLCSFQREWQGAHCVGGKTLCHQHPHQWGQHIAPCVKIHEPIHPGIDLEHTRKLCVTHGDASGPVAFQLDRYIASFGPDPVQPCKLRLEVPLPIMSSATAWDG